MGSLFRLPLLDVDGSRKTLPHYPTSRANEAFLVSPGALGRRQLDTRDPVYTDRDGETSLLSGGRNSRCVDLPLPSLEPGAGGARNHVDHS